MGSNNPPDNAVAGPLSVAAGSSDVQPVDVQPRQPRNMRGLLRFAMEATKAEDAPGNANLGAMDEERQQFLAEALASVTVDLGEVLRNSIEVLTNTQRMQGIKPDEPLPPDVERAFTNLLDIVDDMDLANDVYRLGGFAIFPICLGSQNVSVRMYANRMLGELSQNNPFCQQKVLECGILEVLISLAQVECTEGLPKCLFALSCCCREYEPACNQLVERGGCGVLAQVLTSNKPAIRTKAAFFVRYLCLNHRAAKEEFIKLNIVKKIATQIEAGQDESTEHLLGILQALLDGSDKSVLEQFQDPEIGLQKILQNHLKHPELVDDTYMEEKAYCAELLEKAFKNPPRDSVEDEADR
ncbi:hsp70-binding protein 1-like [Anticarsia gemmatalis]|uniref:hsp70-binding protein 1-like n=1 Tax=Anticarsia gemmatalis TaxID=129554 RepID=UPI003F7781DB